MRKGLSRRHRQGGRPAAGRKRLPFVAFEGLEGRRLYSAVDVAPSQVLHAPDSSQTLGMAVATHGSLVAVAGGGMVAVYDTSAPGATPLTFSGDPSAAFGSSVTFVGADKIAIGAPMGGDNLCGVVYVYDLNAPEAQPEQYSILNMGYQSVPDHTSAFGVALAEYHGHLLVDVQIDPTRSGHNGSVVEIDTDTQTLVHTFVNQDESLHSFDGFGVHMAVSGDQIVFYGQENPPGENFPDSPGPEAVYLFDGWNYRGKFTAPVDDVTPGYGTSLAFGGDAVVIGSRNGGAVYQYSATAPGGAPVHTFVAPDEDAANGMWGFAVAVNGNSLLISAPAVSDADGNYVGRVYSYDLRSEPSADPDYLVTPEAGGLFGLFVAAGGTAGQFVITDPYGNGLAGQSYVYELPVDSPAPETSPPVAKAGDDQSVLIDAEAGFSGADSTADAGVSIVSYEWDFDYDGTNFDADATGVDAAHAYGATGTYTVALKVTDDHGKTSIDTLEVTVALPAAPTADAGSDAAALNGQVVALAGGGTGTGLSYAWDFNYDGTTFNANAVGATSSVAYAASGSHTVALRVTDAYGRSAIDTLVVVTKAPAPTADAGADQSAVAGSGVSFHGTASAGLGATVAGVAWDFDFDGVTFHPVAAGADVNYVYLTAGLHTVAFQVIDSEGNVATDTATVSVVAAAPTVNAGADLAAIAGNAVALHGTATAGTGATVASVEWDFNYDGVTFHPSATGADASATYTTAGAHVVAFRVTDSDGQSAVDTAVVTVTARAPEADAGAAQSVQTGQAVALHGTAAAGLGSSVAGVAWDFNYDGITFDVNATTADASTAYASAGTYTVAFRVTDADGQISIDTAVITVATPAPPVPPVVVVGGQVQVTGTAGNDTVTMGQDANGNVVVSFNGTTYGPFARGSTVVINGGAGNDVITGQRKVAANLVIYGGAGNDTITGGGASDILVGGDGNDTLIAGADRDILIGGAGADNLQGKAGQDIVIAGWTVFDSNPAAQNAILAEWTSGRTFDKRVANLLNGTGSADRLNGSYFLAPGATVFDDAVVDTLSGGGGKDWLIFNATGSGVRDILSDGTGGNVITDLI